MQRPSRPTVCFTTWAQGEELAHAAFTADIAVGSALPHDPRRRGSDESTKELLCQVRGSRIPIDQSIHRPQDRERISLGPKDPPKPTGA
jgi:hypothetical protein